MEPIDLSPVERRVWRAFPTGIPVDLRDSADDDPEDGDTWGAARTVRAEVLRKLLLRAPVDGEVAALRLLGARVTGELNLAHATVEHPARLMACRFERAPVLYGARVRQLNLGGSHLPGWRRRTCAWTGCCASAAAASRDGSGSAGHGCPARSSWIAPGSGTRARARRSCTSTTPSWRTTSSAPA